MYGNDTWDDNETDQSKGNLWKTKTLRYRYVRKIGELCGDRYSTSN